ncbi:MAG: urea ABC transporter ATP-binding subunit UrtE [Candidatus Rokuibacteriota bacterium]|nr:MAG: urea ABC transporter ATP-binding subunit UrtE [Candidatus Rokubacteria bacterium]
MPLLDVRDIDTFYGASHVLHSLSLRVEQSEIECILGRNGVGKTTLLRSIIGLTPPRLGRVVYKGEDITRMRVNKRARLGIGYVPQGREIFPDITVMDNLRLGLVARSDGMTRVPDEIFDFFPMLKPLVDRQGGLLSGGEQQQLAIARALCGNPELLLLDEPTEGIQPSIVQEIERILKRIHQEKKLTIILVEQKIDFAKNVSQEFTIMVKGRVAREADIHSLTDEVIREYLTI